MSSRLRVYWYPISYVEPSAKDNGGTLTALQKFNLNVFAFLCVNLTMFCIQEFAV